MLFDPDCAALVTRLRELDLPRYETMTPLQAREAMAAARKAAAMVPPAIAEARDIVAETSEGSLHARLYRPGSDVECVFSRRRMGAGRSGLARHPLSQTFDRR
jgi:acetyl esterase